MLAKNEFKFLPFYLMNLPQIMHCPSLRSLRNGWM